MATFETPDTRLLRAEQRSLAAAQRIDRLNLDALNRAVPDLDLAEALTAAEAIFVIDGASSLELDLDDPDLIIESSGVLGPNDRGHLRNVQVSLDGILFRLAALKREGPGLHLTFEDTAVQLLRGPTDAKTASRGSMTRAQFIESLVRDVPGNRRNALIPFWSPEKNLRQMIASPEIPDRRSDNKPVAGEGGFDSGAKLKIKGITADAEQKKQLTIALQVADEENAGPKATLAMVTAGIGESSWRRSSTNPGSKAHGVFQLIPATAASTGLDPEDTEATARYYLRHGYYKYGGAIKLAQDNPGISVGEIVSKVEGSDKGGPWYQVYTEEARAIIAAWSKGASHDTSSDPVLKSKSFQFTRGLPDQRESSFTAALRLADDVHWRFFVAAGVAVFVSDDRLMMNPASFVVERGDDAVIDQRWEVDHGKLASNVELQVLANRWSIMPGAVMALRDMGLATGRWLAGRIEHDLFTDVATVQLYKPLAPLKEPAHTVEANDKKPSDSAHPSNSSPNSGGSESNGEAGPGPAYDARGVKASAAASERLKQWRNPNGEILWVCEWMFPQLEFAKKHGWSGVITEGWRSRPTEEIYWDRYGHDPGLAARPGTSNHGWTIHPRGAIDTSDPAGLQRALKGWTGTPAAMKGNGVRLPRDVVHFSADGS